MLNLINLLVAESSSSGETKPSNPWMSYILIGVLVLMLVLTFVFNSRQRKKQQKEAEEKMNAMKVGDKVKTIGLIVGTIVEIDDENNTIVLQTGKSGAENYLTVDKMAVYQTIAQNNDQPEAANDSTDSADSKDSADNDENGHYNQDERKNNGETDNK